MNLADLHKTMGDAGPIGGGAIGFSQEKCKKWSPQIAKESTNYRELLTWALQVDWMKQDISHLTSIYQTDSVVAAAYIRKIYGKSQKLARLSAKTWKKLLKMNAHQIPIVVDQSTIRPADILSRSFSYKNCHLSPTGIQWIQKHFKVQDVFFPFNYKHCFLE